MELDKLLASFIYAAAYRIDPNRDGHWEALNSLHVFVTGKRRIGVGEVLREYQPGGYW